MFPQENEKKNSEVDNTERGWAPSQSCQARSLILSPSPALWSKMSAKLQPLCSYFSQPEGGRGRSGLPNHSDQASCLVPCSLGTFASLSEWRVIYFPCHCLFEVCLPLSLASHQTRNSVKPGITPVFSVALALLCNTVAGT